MEVHRKSWHMRIYLWWYGHKYGTPQEQADKYNLDNDFWGGGQTKTAADFQKTTTNLCPYMRAVLFWAPLRFLFYPWDAMAHLHIDDWKIPLYLNVLTIPLTMILTPFLVGYFSYGLKKFLWVLYGIFALVALLVIVLSWFTDWLKERSKARKPKPPKPAGTFWPLINAWLRSAHDGMCPPIEITDGEEIVIEPTKPVETPAEPTTTDEWKEPSP